MSLLRYGERTHGIGGKIREVSVGDDRLSVSWMSNYDHVEAQQSFHRGYAILSLAWRDRGYAFGVKLGEDYARIYLGVGELLIGIPEEGEFEAIYG